MIELSWYKKNIIKYMNWLPILHHLNHIYTTITYQILNILYNMVYNNKTICVINSIVHTFGYNATVTFYTA